MEFNNKIYSTCDVVLSNLKWKVNLVDKKSSKLFDNNDLKKEDLDENDGSLGITNYNKVEISLRRNLTREMLYRVAIHELTHACLYSTNTTNKSGKYDEETICEFNESWMPEIVKLAKKITKKFERFLVVE